MIRALSILWGLLAPALVCAQEAPRSAFRLVEVEGARELRLGERTLWRHRTAFEQERFEETYRPYTDLLAADGTRLTKDAGGTHPHHRGLYAGWRRVSVGDEAHDMWSMGGAPRPSQRHVGWVEELEELDGDRAVCAPITEWRAGDGTPLVRDERVMTTHRPTAGRMVLDVELRLHALVDGVSLDGDPRHGGFQVRLAQECAEREDVEYMWPEGVVELGNDDWNECPWVLARYSVAGSPHAIAILDHPGNPRPTTFNTRAYGRFGPFFRAELPRGEPLVVRYRVVLWDLGERAAPDAAEVGQLARSFGS